MAVLLQQFPKTITYIVRTPGHQDELLLHPFLVSQDIICRSGSRQVQHLVSIFDA